MFTVGIFTTHLPYLAFIAFYAWFLLFGVEQAQQGKIQIAEKSIQIEYHFNKSKTSAGSLYHYFYSDKYESSIVTSCCNKLKIKQKWRTYNSPYKKPDFLFEGSFCRPPPAIA